MRREPYAIRSDVDEPEEGSRKESAPTGALMKSAESSVGAGEFTGKVALVTGGTRGIGRAIADAFASKGATVVVCGRHAPEEVGNGGDSGPQTTRAAEFVACDVRDFDAVQMLVSTILHRHGRLDIVVNNAGGSPGAESASAGARFSEAVVRLNLLAPLFVSQAANAAMQSQHSGGSIVNITSLSALRPSPESAAYGAAKAGLVNLTATLAVEWAPKVRVNSVCAGLIRTERASLWYGDEQSIALVAATIPMGRMGLPADIAEACCFLASEKASFVTGANLVVHGGGETPAYLGAARSG